MSARTPAPPKKPREWIAYRMRGAKAERLGHVRAPAMDEAIAEAATEYGVDPKRILVQRVADA
jgi:membrane-bound lytic murein transglycosylase B